MYITRNFYIFDFYKNDRSIWLNNCEIIIIKSNRNFFLKFNIFLSLISTFSNLTFMMFWINKSYKKHKVIFHNYLLFLEL